MKRPLSIGTAILALSIPSIRAGAQNTGHGFGFIDETSPIPPKWNPTTSELIKNVRQIEIEGQTTVTATSNCKPGLMGYYRPYKNTIFYA